MPLRKPLAALFNAFERLISRRPQPASLALEPLESRALFSAGDPSRPQPVLNNIIIDKAAYGIGDDIRAVVYFSNWMPNFSVHPIGELESLAPTGIWLYLDIDKNNKITDADTTIGYSSIDSRSQISVSTTDLPIGHHTLLARAAFSTDDSNPLSLPTAVVSTSIDIYRAVTSITIAPDKEALTYTDENGNSVTATLTGPGTIRAFFSTPEGENSDPDILQVLNPTLSSNLKIQLSAPANTYTEIETLTTASLVTSAFEYASSRPPGTLYIMSIEPYRPPTDYPLGSIDAPDVDITKSFQIHGKINSYKFHSVSKSSILITDPGYGTGPIIGGPDYFLPYEPSFPVYGPSRPAFISIGTDSSANVRGNDVSVYFAFSTLTYNLGYWGAIFSPANESRYVEPGSTLWFYLDNDNDGAITAADTALGSATSADSRFTFSSDDLALGKHKLLARATSSVYSADYEGNPNLVGVTEFTLYRSVVSSTQTDKKETLTYTDANSRKVNVTLTGPGSFQAYFETEEGVDGDASIIRLHNTTTASALAFAIPGAPNASTSIKVISTDDFINHYAGDSQYGWLTIAYPQVIVTPVPPPPASPLGSLKSISGACIDLTESLRIPGYISSIVLHDVTDARIVISASPKGALAVTFNDVTESSLYVVGNISTLRVNSWSGTGDLEADTIGSIFSAGNFSASVYTNTYDTNRQVIGVVNVKGVISGNWSLNTHTDLNKIGSITAGSAYDWHLLAGSVGSITLGPNSSSNVSISAMTINSLVINSDIEGLTLNLNNPTSFRNALGRLLVRGNASSVNISSIGAENTGSGPLTFQQSILNSNIVFNGHVSSFTAGSMYMTTVQGTSIASVRVLGDANNGNFIASRELTTYNVWGAVIPNPGASGIGSVFIAGEFSNSYIQSNASIGLVQAGSYVAASISASGRINSIIATKGSIDGVISADIIGNIRSADSLQANIFASGTIGSIDVRNNTINSSISSVGSLFSFATGTLIDSSISAGSYSGDLFHYANPDAYIGAVLVRNRNYDGGPSFARSIINAPQINRVSLRTISFENSGYTSGIFATRYIGRITSDDLPSVLNMTPLSPPQYHTDFVIKVVADVE